MTLEAMLYRLSRHTLTAQQRWEAQQRAENDYADDEEIEGDLWLSLEQDLRGVWLCGWRVRVDEATTWALHEAGSAASAAAERLLQRFSEAA